jgi:hypothetical protein
MKPRATVPSRLKVYQAICAMDDATYAPLARLILDAVPDRPRTTASGRARDAVLMDDDEGGAAQMTLTGDPKSEDGMRSRRENKHANY